MANNSNYRSQSPKQYLDFFKNVFSEEAIQSIAGRD